MRNRLSICIVGRDKAGSLGECIRKCLEVCRRVVYLDTGSTDDSIKTAQEEGAGTVLSSASMSITRESVARACDSEWVLFLASDEMPVARGDLDLEDVLTRSAVEGYSLIVKSATDVSILENYQWMRINEQYKYGPECVYISRIEIRLIHHRRLVDILERMVAGVERNLFSSKHQHLTGLEIHPCGDDTREQQEDAVPEDRERQMKYLRGELSYEPVAEDNLSELEDKSLIYSVLTMDDLPSFRKGMSMGVGGERMYLFMLNYLGQFGRYEEARDFFESWEEEWTCFDTLEPYRVGGIVYANLLDFDKAALCLEKYTESAPDEALGEPLSALAKVYLLQGWKDKALALFKRVEALGFEEDFVPVIQIVERDNWQPAELSVCMIARDEEGTIGKALESVAPIADEIVVVDTGSADGTKMVARQFTDLILDAPWEDDFSKARNLGLQNVTGDYVLCLDADEFIDARERINLGLFKQIIAVERKKAYQIRVEPEHKDEEIAVMLRLPRMNQGDYQIRLFPADRRITFDGEAYECVDKSIRDTDIGIQRNDQFRIMHSSIDPKQRASRKTNAARAAFDTVWKPEDAMKGFIHFLKIGEPDTAAQWLKKTDIQDPELLAKIAEYYVSTAEIPDMIAELVQKGLEISPACRDLILAKAEIDFANGRYEEICGSESHIELMAAENDRQGFARMSYLYGMAQLGVGNLGEGIKHLGNARDEDPWNTRYRVGGVYVLAKCGEWEDAIDSAGGLARDEGMALEWTIRDFADVGIVFGELALHFLETDQMEAAAFFSEILEIIKQTKISGKHETDRVDEWLNGTGKALKEMING